MTAMVARVDQGSKRSHHGADSSSVRSLGFDMRTALRNLAQLFPSSSSPVPALWHPLNADSSSCLPYRELGERETALPSLLPTTHQISLVVHTLGFTKRQLGDVFGVSRQAIYNWLKGIGIADAHARKLLLLASLLADITRDTQLPLYHRFTTQPLAPGQPSIYELLCTDPWDTDKISALLRRARELTTERQASQGVDRNDTRSSRADDNLTDNLLSLG